MTSGITDKDEYYIHPVKLLRPVAGGERDYPMRCPECTVRNSVAAVVCKDCGTKLPRRKGVPKDVLIAVGAVVLVGGVTMAGLAALPSLFDSEGNLQKLAKKVALGPKSPDEATRMKTDLESGIRSYLEHKLQVPSPELVTGLQKIFPSSAFEVHIAELPEGLRLVEVDTILQSSNFVLSPKHVAVLRDFDIYDTAVIVPEGDKKTMILLGHGNVQEGRKPQVRLFTVEADGLKEKSEKSVPPLTGEGSAVLQKNGHDITLELSLASRATEEKLFLGGAYRAAGVADETVRPRLVYRNGAYELADDNGRSPLAALRAAAFLVADPSQKDRFRRYLAPAAQDQLSGLGQLKVFPPAFLIKRTGGGGGNPSYVIGNTDDAFEVSLARDGGIYQVKSIRRAKALPVPSETEVAVTPPSYEGNTSTLVDKLLASPDNHSAPVTTAGSSTTGSAPAPISAPTSTEKIVERAAGGERGSVSDKVDNATVKVRSGPSTSYKTVTEVPRGSELDIIGKQDGWYKVRCGDKEGYIYGAFVNCSTNDAYAVAVAKRHKSVKNENNITISHVETGDRVVVLDASRSDKYKVQLTDGRVGYVYKEILEIEGGSRQLASAAPTGAVKPVTMPVQTTAPVASRSQSQGQSQRQSHSPQSQGSGTSSSTGSGHSSSSRSSHSSSSQSSSNSNNSASRKNSDDSEQESRHSRRRHRHRHRHSHSSSSSGSASSNNSPPPFVP